MQAHLEENWDSILVLRVVEDFTSKDEFKS